MRTPSSEQVFCAVIFHHRNHRRTPVGRPGHNSDDLRGHHAVQLCLYIVCQREGDASRCCQATRCNTSFQLGCDQPRLHQTSRCWFGRPDFVESLTSPMLTATSLARRLDVLPDITITSIRYPVNCLLVSSSDIELATSIHLSTDTVEVNRRRLESGVFLVVNHVSSEMTVTSAPVSIVKRRRLRLTIIVTHQASLLVVHSTTPKNGPN